MMFAKTVARALSRLGLDRPGAAPFPRQPAPMLLQKADALFPSPDWTYEPKWDVFRELQHVLQTDAVKLTEGFPAEKSARLTKACAHMGLEGVVMKRKDSIYRPGFRSHDWVKVPIRHREEFVVAGYLPSPRGFST